MTAVAAATGATGRPLDSREGERRFYMGEYYPMDPQEIRNRGTKGIMAAGAGVGLWVVNALIHIPVVGWIIGGGLVFLGISGLFGKSKTDRASGSIMVAAGVAGLATILLPHLTNFLLGAGGLALVGYGAWNIVKFVKGLRSRA
jgi:hypothetical protein